MIAVRNSTIGFCLTFLIGCGPTIEQKTEIAARQKAKEDSLIKAVQVQTEQRMVIKLALKDSIQIAGYQIAGYENRMTYTTGELEAAKDKLNIIKQPQFLRTPDEREQQVLSQTIRVTNLEKELKDIQIELESLKKQRNRWAASLQELD